MFRRKHSDRALLRACLRGNTQAFEPLVTKYQSLVCAITYSGTGNLDRSEELAQETFLLAWQHLTSLRDLNSFQAWLCRIARSRVQSWLRQAQKDLVAKAAPLETASDQVTLSAEPEDAAISEEQHDVVTKALARIPEKYREPLILFYREEKSAHEVALRLGLRENTARQRISRGRKMLRDRVADMVETTLERSRPGKGLVLAVMAGLAEWSPKGASASIAIPEPVANAAAIGAWGMAAAGAAAGLILGGAAVLYHASSGSPPPASSDQLAASNAQASRTDTEDANEITPAFVATPAP